MKYIFFGNVLHRSVSILLINFCQNKVFAFLHAVLFVPDARGGSTARLQNPLASSSIIKQANLQIIFETMIISPPIINYLQFDLFFNS